MEQGNFEALRKNMLFPELSLPICSHQALSIQSFRSVILNHWAAVWHWSKHCWKKNGSWQETITHPLPTATSSEGHIINNDGTLNVHSVWLPLIFYTLVYQHCSENLPVLDCMDMKENLDLNFFYFLKPVWKGCFFFSLVEICFHSTVQNRYNNDLYWQITNTHATSTGPLI